MSNKIQKKKKKKRKKKKIKKSLKSNKFQFDSFFLKGQSRRLKKTKEDKHCLEQTEETQTGGCMLGFVLNLLEV